MCVLSFCHNYIFTYQKLNALLHTIYYYTLFLIISNAHSPVGLGCRIKQLPLCRGVRTPPPQLVFWI